MFDNGVNSGRIVKIIGRINTGIMQMVFEIAKQGNLIEIKRLFDSQTDLSIKDENGNTLLLIAAYAGHLDIVKWILSSDSGMQAQVNETNNAGNSALLLASAYGHLDTVKWLLSNEGGAQITETNQLGNTALLLAAKHEQLPVLDFLIRNYYPKLAFNEKETDFIEAISLNTVTGYYLTICKLFLSQDTNYKKIQVLLDEAKTRLSTDELTYIHQIVLWQIINFRIVTPHSISDSLSIDSCVDTIPDSYRAELIYHMLSNGFVIHTCSFQSEEIVITGVIFDEAQQELIQEILKQAKNDPNYLLKRSATEGSNFLNHYYLTPLYESIIRCLQNKDDINIVLSDPFYYKLQNRNKTTADDKIARGVAYHFCQRSDITIPQHYDAFTGFNHAGRVAYYDTVKEYYIDTTNYESCSGLFLDDSDSETIELTNEEKINGLSHKCLPELIYTPSSATINSENKKLLLQILGNIPGVNGDRLFWIKEYPVWLENLGKCLMTSTQETPDTLKLIGLNQPIPISSEFVQQLWNKLEHAPQPSILPGNHPVFKITSSAEYENSVYFKLYVGMPGINDALQYLYRRLFGIFGGLPWSVAGLLEVDSQSIPVLISEDAGSPIENDDSRLLKLDPYSLSKLILFTILTNSEDGKKANHSLKKNARGLFDLYSVDNDQALVESTTETDYIVFKTKKLAVKSFVFCLDEMKGALDEKVVEEFLSLNPVKTLQSWLQDLRPLTEQYDLLFKDCKEQAAQHKNAYRRSYLDLVIPISTVIQLTFKIQRLQAMLSENRKTKPIILLEEVEPVVASYYEPILELQNLSPTKRFDHLVSKDKLYRWCEESQSYSTTITASRELYEALVPNNNPEGVTPLIALGVLDAIHQRGDVLRHDQLLILQGKMTQINALPRDEYQTLLKLTRLNQFTHEKRKLFLETLSKNSEITSIHLRYPLSTLTSSLLASILKNKTNLEYLSITKATGLNSLSSVAKAPSLRKIKLLDLPKIERFIGNYPELTELIIKDCSQLIKLELNAPNLKRLTVIGCENLNEILLGNSLNIEYSFIQDCPKQPLSSFFVKWPGFISRFCGLPGRLQQRLADCVSNSFNEPITEKTAIYDIVSNYLSELNILVAPLLKQIEARSSPGAAYVLAHIGYDIVKVIDILFEWFDWTSLSITKTSIHAATGAIIALNLDQCLIVDRYLNQEYNYANGIRYHRFIFDKIILTDDRVKKIFLEELTKGNPRPFLNALHEKNMGIDKGEIIPSMLNLWRKKIRHPERRRDATVCIIIMKAIELNEIKDERIIEQLLIEINNKNMRIRIQAVFTLIFIGVFNDQILTSLFSLKNYLIPTIERGSDRKLLLDLPFRSDTLELEKRDFIKSALKEKSIATNEWVVIYLLDKLKSNCRIAYEMITILKISDYRIVFQLLEIAGQNWKPSQVYAINALISLGKYSDRILCIIRNLMILNIDFVALYLIDAVISLNIVNKRIITSLLEQLKHQSPEIIEQAILYLLKLNIEDNRIIDALINLLENNTDRIDSIMSLLEKNRDLLNNERVLTTLFSLINNNKRHVFHLVLKTLLRTNELDDQRDLRVHGLIKCIFGYFDDNLLNTLEIKDRFFYSAIDIISLHISDVRLANTIINAAKSIHKDSIIPSAAYPGCYNIEENLKKKFAEHQLIAVPELVFSVGSQTPTCSSSEIYGENTYNNITEIQARATSQSNLVHDFKLVNNLETTKDIVLKPYDTLSSVNEDECPTNIEGCSSSNHAENDKQISDRLEGATNENELAHHSELLSLMIRQGHMPDNYYLKEEQLVISDMTVDEKQIIAIEKLIKQSVYQPCIKKRNSEIIENRIYLDLLDSNELQYTVIDPRGQVQTANISVDDLVPGLKLIAPLTLDQVEQVFSNLLIITTLKQHTRPVIETLTFSNVDLIKGYSLVPKIKYTQYIEKNTIYLEALPNGTFAYHLKSPEGKIVQALINTATLTAANCMIQLPLNAMQLNHVLPAILKITQQAKHTPETEGLAPLLKLLQHPLIMSNIKSLNLTNCGICDVDLRKIAPVLGQSRTLVYLNLDNNHITQTGLKEFLRSLHPQSILRTLSIRFNDIIISHDSYLRELRQAAHTPLRKIELEGNNIGNYATIVKKEHKKRVNALIMLFSLLADQSIAITVGQFLECLLNIVETDEYDGRLLCLTSKDIPEIRMPMTDGDFETYRELSFKEVECEERMERFKSPTSQTIFSYLIASIYPQHIPKYLRETNLHLNTRSFVEQKQLSKQLLCFHTNAQLKSQLSTYSLFSSKRLAEAQSIMCPERKISLHTGRVYLIANQGKTKQHVMLAYEFLTGYGQRIFKVAHLKYNKTNNKTFIKFITPQDLPGFIVRCERKKIIAGFDAPTKCIKEMNRAIEKDKEYENLPDVEYSSIVSASSSNENTHNCLTYCLQKISRHLNVFLDPGVGTIFPSSAVTKFRDQLEKQECNSLLTQSI